jgi:3-oxoacyl-[acyl-carrier protein] reductase
MEDKLPANNILLTLGASSEIGGAIIRDVCEDNTVILAQFNKSHDHIETLRKDLGEKIVPIKADLSNEKDIHSLISFIESNYSFPTKIVHLSAPKVNHIRFKDIRWDDYSQNFAVQLKPIILILKHFLPLMAKCKSGKVVFALSSYTLNVPPKALSQYITTKYALLGLMKSLASEYADQGIQINAVSPSLVETKFLSEIPNRLIEMEADLHPLKRNAIPEDIAPVVKFLLSNASNFINGVNMPITGGKTF